METAHAQEGEDAPSQQPPAVAVETHPEEEMDGDEHKNADGNKSRTVSFGTSGPRNSEVGAEKAKEEASKDQPMTTSLTFILTEDEDVPETGTASQPALATVCSESVDDVAPEKAERPAPVPPSPSRSGTRIEANAKPQQNPAGASLIWFSGSLWKLSQTGDRDQAELMSWRRRYFMISWAEPVGLVMSYVSEKENCKRHLGCIVRRKGINTSANITRLAPLDMVIPEEDKPLLLDSCKQYDLAVHRTKFDKDEFDRMQLPAQLHRIMIDGMDHKGKPRRLVVALDNAQTMLGWLLMLETVAEHHIEEALL